MPPDLSPGSVAARLARLRESCTLLTRAEARALLEPVGCPRPFAEAVSARLAELRALVELTQYLHRARNGRK